MDPKEVIKSKSEENQQDSDNSAPQKLTSDKENLPKSSTQKSGTRGG